MKEDNLSGICIEPDLRNLYLRLNNERLPIIENGRIELFPITEHEQETGGAADVKEIQFPTNSTRNENAPTIAGVERGEPIDFPLGMCRVIAGWDEGIMLMSKGEKGVLYIPYYLGYGDRGAGGVIPPFATLIFEVELVDF